MSGLGLDALTAEDLAELFGVTSRAVRQWPGAGMPFVSVKGKSIRYRWRDAFRWWLENRYHPPAPSAGAGKVSRSESEARKAAADARLKELRLEREMGRLLLQEDVEAEWTGKVVAARARLLALPARLRGPLGPAAAGLVDQEVRLILAELAQGAQQVPA